MKKLILLMALMVPLIFVQTAGATPLNLVVNGGFETGYFTPEWTVKAVSSGVPVTPWVGNDGDTFKPYSGNYAAWFGAGGTVDDVITQGITTVAGQSYTFDFFLRHNYPNTINNDFNVTWDGAPVLALKDDTGFDWTHYSFTEKAAGTTTSISFAGYENDTWYGVDDVSVTATPIPGAVWLLGSGLLGLTFLSRKKIFNG